MLQLVYASAATKPFSDDALTTLLTKARARNTFYSVTGMLLYHSGSFLQVLEGPEASVDLILSSIARDPRHKNTKILFRQTTREREFQDWAMGFVDTSSTATKATGMVDYYRTLPKLTVASTDAKKYLRFFQDGLCRQLATTR